MTLARATATALAALLGLGCGSDSEDTACETGACSTATTDETGTPPTTAASASTTTPSPTSTAPGDPSETGEETSSTSSPNTTDTTDTTDIPASPGCGKPPLHASGGVQVTIDAGPAGDGMRSFFLSLPADYDPGRAHRLVVGYPGTDWLGEMIQPYLDLESNAEGDEIFVYPDPLWRDFTGWGTYGGWVLGPHAAPADGDQDINFTAALLDFMADTYCIDTTRVFATGHSWGGDMAHVVSCFLGDRFRAAVPIAANRPYWFMDDGAPIHCPGETAVWTMFGADDDHFTDQDYPGQYGDECRDFWLGERACTGVMASTDLGLGAAMECVEYTDCAQPTRYCLYSAEFGHQRPDYFPAEAMKFFRSF